MQRSEKPSCDACSNNNALLSFDRKRQLFAEFPYTVSAPCESGMAGRMKPIQTDMVLACCLVILSTAKSTFISSNCKCQTN